jgi:hypothetical protein
MVGLPSGRLVALQSTDLAPTDLMKNGQIL